MFNFLKNKVIASLTPEETLWYKKGTHLETRRKFKFLGRNIVSRTVYDDQCHLMMYIYACNNKIETLATHQYENGCHVSSETWHYKYSDDNKRILDAHYQDFYDDYDRPIKRRVFNEDGSFTDTDRVYDGKPRIEERVNRYGEDNQYIDRTMTVYDEYGRYVYSHTETTQNGRTWYNTHSYIYDGVSNKSIKEIYYNSFHDCYMVTTRKYDDQGEQIYYSSVSTYPTFQTFYSSKKQYSNRRMSYTEFNEDRNNGNKITYFCRVGDLTRGYIYEIPKKWHWLFKL